MIQHNRRDTEQQPALWCGLDIGGTKIELAMFDADFGELFRHRIDTPRDRYETFVAAVAGLVESGERELGRPASAVGIGLPGRCDRQSGLQHCSSLPALSQRPLAADLGRRLARPLALANDCQCFALSEANGGAGAGVASMLGVILGTGASGCHCVDGKVVNGYNGLVSEWGHWSIPASLLERHALPLLDCACGLRGCLERYVSGSGLAQLHRLLGGHAVDAGDVLARAQAGDALAQRTCAIHLDLLGQAMATLVLGFDPHVIVLGGGLSRHAALYAQLPAATAAHLFSGVRVPPIVPARFGDAGGARGAALLARQHHAGG